MHINKIFLGAAMLGLAFPSQAAWTLVDDFDGYDNNSITTIGSNAGGDASAGVWDGVFDGTGNAHIYVNLDDANDNELEVYGIPSQGATGWRGASTDLANNFVTDFTLLDNSTSTLFFQFMAGNSGTFDCMFGLTDSQAVLDNSDAWMNFAVMPFLAGGGAGVADFRVSEGTIIENVAADTWYNVWLVVDTANNTFAVYSSTGTDDGTLGVSGSAFRNNKGLGSLAAFGMAEREDGAVRIDNVYLDIGNSNTSYPVQLPMTTVYYDDFSGSGSSSLNGTNPDATTDGATWSAHASILDNGSPVNADDASALLPIKLESNKLYRLSVELTPGASIADNDWVGFGFNQAGALSNPGATPGDNTGRFTDNGINGKVWAILREAASNAAGDQDIQFFSSVTSGAISTTETDAGFDGFATHKAVIDLSTMDGVLTTRLMIDDADITSGFQTVSGVALRDINGVGITHNNTTQTGVGFGTFTLEVSTTNDDDDDGMPDAWEQQIIDDNPGDSITNIVNVLPEDDYDDDGFSNLMEYELGLNPTAQDGSHTDTDGDYLPDLWEIQNLSNITYNAYDDPDRDGFNNQAERIGATNPLDISDYPDHKAPSVAFMRDSMVTNNALLMANGGYYGNAINGISYQDQIIHTFDGYQYTAYYDTVGSIQNIVLARRTVDDTHVGMWEKYQTDSQFLNGDESAWDAHNVIVFGICPADGTLHLSWDHHNHTLRYRSSVAGLCTTNKAAWGSGMLNAEQNWLVDSSTPEYDVTYPQFIATPDGGLVLNRRKGISGNGDQLIQLYDPFTGTWNPGVQFINRTGTYTGPNPWGSTVTANERCAYINGLDFDTNGTMHVTWTWRESASQYGNRDICYAYSPDMGLNWYNNEGIHIADTGIGQKITMNSPGITVIPLNMRQLMINQQAQCVDNDGRVHALMLHRRQDPGYGPDVFSALFSTRFTAYYHYFRDPATGEWSQRRIPPDDYPVGSRPRIGYDVQGNVYAAYLSCPAGTDVFPGYRENDDFSPLVIASASKASGYSDWKVLQVINQDFDGEPLLDQVRLLSDNILAVYIQEHDTYISGNGIPTPLHVYEFAVDIPEPPAMADIAYTFMGDDVLVSAHGQTGSNYQLQVSMDLTDSNGWSSVGAPAGGMDSLIALPDADGLQSEKSFFRVFCVPVP